MSLQVITGGCQGTDVAAMYWADLFDVPFHCILPHHHSMKYDLENKPSAPWHIGISYNDGCWLFTRRKGINDGHYSILRSLVKTQSLTSRPKEEPEAGSTCKALNSNFPNYSQPSKAYLQRDHLIAKTCDRVVALGCLTPDASVDARGEKSFVHGGTGWTVRLAQRLAKPVYLYDIYDRIWLTYDYDQQRFIKSPSPPVLEGKCAIVGYRHMTPTTTAYDEIQELFYQAARRSGSL